MERLTIRNSDGSVSQPTATTIAAVFQRLAAYEDTGLAPEDLDLGLNAAVRKKAGAEYYGITPDQMERAVELFHAEEEGYLHIAPCKIGDTVFWVHGGVVSECRVGRLQVNRTGLFICLRSKVSHGAFRVDLSWKKYIFPTREEAEAALQSVTNRNGLERGGFQNGNSHDAVKNWPPYLDLPKRNESLVEKQATSDLYDEDGGDIYE